MALRARKCRECGESYKATRRDAMYCSKACKVAAWRSRRRPAGATTAGEAIDQDKWLTPGERLDVIQDARAISAQLDLLALQLTHVAIRKPEVAPVALELQLAAFHWRHLGRTSAQRLRWGESLVRFPSLPGVKRRRQGKDEDALAFLLRELRDLPGPLELVIRRENVHDPDELELKAAGLATNERLMLEPIRRAVVAISRP